MSKQKLKLEVFDRTTGDAVVTHHFYYVANDDNRLRLTITDNTYILDKDGKLVILTQKEIDQEEQRRTK